LAFKFDALVFDLDGTLVDSARLIFGAFNHVAEYYLGRRFEPEEITRFFGPSEESTWRNLLPPDKVEEGLRRYYQYYRDRQMECVLFDGVRPLLERLKQTGVKLAIATGRGAKTTGITVEHLGLEKYFPVILTSGDITRPKPDPEVVQLACHRLQVSPEKTLMVGDSAMDVEAGRAAGTATAAVLWGSFGLGGPVQQAGPDYAFETPSAFEAFLWNGVRSG